ncbi:MAG TPA: MogA/MoaB family molybdenum cofactor biosynthesis protein [Tepidisphaeraceae bacterium]|jgi:molybdenum cofactor biosynthesis protein B|nr:MogA/MoaB family molybdenum cofactor biosynthesis protein [Tepidisphaeraceae bacterium]
MSHVEHKETSAGIQARCAVITLSDTRSEATDTSGAKIKALLGAEHHLVSYYSIIPDDAQRLGMMLEELISSGDVDVILTNGGTGISRRDHTIPVIEKHLTTVLPGFGELFRMLSYQQIGSSAMMSRAVAGIARDKLVFALPGSTTAVELAVTKLILPELGHLLGQMRK